MIKTPIIGHSSTTNLTIMDKSAKISKISTIIGLLFVVINVYWIAIMSELWYSLFTLVNPFSNAIFTLGLLVFSNYILSRLLKRSVLSWAEMLAIYVMVTIASTISGATLMTSIMGTLAHPFWYATPENEWQRLFWQYIPSWFTVSDLNILKGYYSGGTTIHTVEHIKAWSVPVIVWSTFTFVLFFSLFCISSLIRKQWMENEKLSYPIVQLPLAMVTGRRFFGSRFMWAGFSIVAFTRILNGFHDLFPVVPQFPYGYRLDHFFTERPWNAIGYTWMSFNFAIVGLTYFMPLDLSFSCWFFFWLTRAERVIGNIMGFKNLYLNERASGAWIGISIFALIGSRRHIADLFRNIFERSRPGEYREALGHNTAIGLFLLCLLFIFSFCYLAGMSVWAIVVFFIIYYALAIALGRVRAELGPPYHELIDINPRKIMIDLFGSLNLRGNNLTVMTFLYGYNRCSRAHTMPAEVEALKIGERAGFLDNRLTELVALSLGVGSIATFWSYLQIAYKYGVSSKLRGWIIHSGWESFNPLQNLLQYPQGTNVLNTCFMCVGFLTVLTLHLLRTHFLWFPLHASGYVLSGASWGGMIYFWFPVMVSWLIKLMILKYGGRGLYKKAIPFFLGLVLGDYMPRSILSLVGLGLDVYMPSAGSGHTL